MQDETTTSIWLCPWTYRGHNHRKAQLVTSETPYKCVRLQMCHRLHLMPYTCLYPIFRERENKLTVLAPENEYCFLYWKRIWCPVVYSHYTWVSLHVDDEYYSFAIFCESPHIRTSWIWLLRSGVGFGNVDQTYMYVHKYNWHTLLYIR